MRRESLTPEAPLIDFDPASIPVAEIPIALIQLAAVQTALVARLAGAPASAPEYNLDADAVAARLGCCRRTLFRKAKRLPFVKRISRKVLVGSEAGLNRYLANRRA